MPNSTPNDIRQWDESTGYDELNKMLLRQFKENMPDANRFMKENIGPIAGGAFGSIGGPAGTIYGASLGKFLQNTAEGKGMPQELGGPIGGPTGPNGLLQGVPSTAVGTALGEGVIAGLPYLAKGVTKLTPEVLASLSRTLGNERGAIRLGRVETPIEVVPEISATSYELPIQTPNRLQRAADMGFDTSKTWYHGTQRPDRVIEGGGFSQKRATSGPMAYFTENPELASSYATGKRDTSLFNEDANEYTHWFQFKPKGSRTRVDLNRAWWHITPQERQDFLANIKNIGMDDETGAVVKKPDGGLVNPQTFDYELNRARGNGFQAAKETWLNSGSVFNQEHKFMDVLKEAGIDTSRFKFNDPFRAEPAVFPVHLKMQNPLKTGDTETINQLIPILEKASARQPLPKYSTGADPWDKSTRNAIDWVKQLKEDTAKGENSMAWTSIPDWVTRKLRELGYDGIIDTGGKMGGIEHQVAIPFQSNQVRSPWANYDPAKAKSRNLLASLLAAFGLEEASNQPQ